MGELVNLSLVLAVLAALFALTPKRVIPGQIVVASLSTTFIAIVFWKISHNLSAKHVTTSCQLQQNVLNPPSSIATFGIYH
jgi:hypothetical protein